MGDITQIEDFIGYNKPIFDEIKSSDKELSEALSNVIEQLFEKYVVVDDKPKQVVADSQFSLLTNIQLQDEIDTQKELIELYDDPEDPDSIEAEAKLLELELELENRLK